MSAPSPLTVQGLGKAYRRRAVLRDVDLSVEAGEAVALVGSNGTGKSTLLGCITAERVPDRGEIRVCGADPFSDPRETARCMGFVPERPYLYEELTVGEVIEFVASVRGMPESTWRPEAERLLALLNLPGAEGLLCRELSQGMGRKTAILLGLLHRPRLILLDEALNGLDAPSTAALLEELERRRAEGAAALISSHDLGFLAGWCDRGLLLSAGAGWTMLEGAAWERWGAAPSLQVGEARSPGSGTRTF